MPDPWTPEHESKLAQGRLSASGMDALLEELDRLRSLLRDLSGSATMLQEYVVAWGQPVLPHVMETLATHLAAAAPTLATWPSDEDVTRSLHHLLHVCEVEYPRMKEEQDRLREMAPLAVAAMLTAGAPPPPDVTSKWKQAVAELDLYCKSHGITRETYWDSPSGRCSTRFYWGRKELDIWHQSPLEDADA